MTTLTPTRLAAMPRVNLLPPEIAAAARLRRLKMMLGALVAGALVLVVMGYVFVSGQVGAAEEELTTAQGQGQQLQAEVAEYAEVPEVTQALDTATSNLQLAMTPEIRWSFYLNDLGLITPRSSRLSTLIATNAAAEAQANPASSEVLEGAVTPLGQPSMGTIGFTGTATDFNAVAAWLQALGRQEGLVEPSVTAVGPGDDENTRGTFYTVDTSAQLTPDAASNRYLQVGAE